MTTGRRRIMIVTGTRAEYGLLRSVIEAVRAHEHLDLQLVATGTHLLPPAWTIDEVRSTFPVLATVEMQQLDETGRLADVAALGRGITGFAALFEDISTDIVLVLGDRIEALAAAAAASIGGLRVAHLHGGDRAEGVADEAMRHAISKLAHLHFPATPTSAERLARMGEDPASIFTVGSPALDELAEASPLDDARYEELGSPEILLLHHPIGDSDEREEERMDTLIRCARSAGRTLVLHPNHDPGRDGIMHAIAQSGCQPLAHLPRREFLGLLRRIRLLLGNSSAGLIECAAIGVPVVNVGVRQNGRERAVNVTEVAEITEGALAASLAHAMSTGHTVVDHPFGDGRAGERIAHLLATLPLDAMPPRKRNTY